MQVYFLPPTLAVTPAFVHFAPALTTAWAGLIEEIRNTTIKALKNLFTVIRIGAIDENCSQAKLANSTWVRKN